jgi:predicted esterase
MQAHGSWGVAFAPADVSTPRPVIAYLHGMWASPEQSCGTFIKAAAPFGWLVCPRGNAPLGQGRMWAGTGADALRQLHRALDAAGALAPGKLDRADGTLVGYSNGAYFAAEAACAEKGRWTGLVLLSMKLALDPPACGRRASNGSCSAPEMGTTRRHRCSPWPPGSRPRG